jgi:hypothetical protein
MEFAFCLAGSEDQDAGVIVECGNDLAVVSVEPAGEVPLPAVIRGHLQ